MGAECDDGRISKAARTELDFLFFEHEIVSVVERYAKIATSRYSRGSITLHGACDAKQLCTTTGCLR